MKRAVQWVLWTPLNTIITVIAGIGLFMVVLLVVGGASNTAPAAAQPTPTEATSSPSFAVPTITPAPLPPVTTPTIPPVTPTLPGAATADPAAPEAVADSFMRTWLDVHTMDRAKWEATLIPLTTGADMTAMIRGVDPSMIPAAQVVLTTRRAAGEQQASIEVGITNGDTYYVELTRNRDGVWRITSADPYGGDTE